MKTLSYLVLPAALISGLATDASADSGALTHDELRRVLEQASQHGFTHYEEISSDDDEGHWEVEGWREDGWQLDVDMRVSDGHLLHERKSKSQIPDWSLTGEEVREALDNALEAGLERFAQLDVDADGHLEIEGYDAQQREMELRLNRTDLSVTDVEHD
ncbi:hypothetical protein GCM10027040_30910 [Halomonas shantousis]